MAKKARVHCRLSCPWYSLCDTDWIYWLWSLAAAYDLAPSHSRSISWITTDLHLMYSFIVFKALHRTVCGYELPCHHHGNPFTYFSMQKLWFCVPVKLRRRATSIHCITMGTPQAIVWLYTYLLYILARYKYHNGIVVLSTGMGANVGIMRNMMTQLLNGNRVAIHQRRITANSFAHSTMSLSDRCSAFTAGRDATLRQDRQAFVVGARILFVCLRTLACIHY